MFLRAPLPSNKASEKIANNINFAPVRTAPARELESQLTEFEEQLSVGVITQEDSEQKRKKLLEELKELKKQLFAGWNSAHAHLCSILSFSFQLKALDILR